MSDQPPFPRPSQPASDPQFHSFAPPRPEDRWDPPTSPLPVAPPPPPQRKQRRTGLAAAALAATVLVAGGAGYGGAAIHSALADDAPSTASTGAPTSSSSLPLVSTPDTPAAEGSVEQVAAAVLPAVVKLNVSGALGSGSGSGIILTEDGLILTNHHVTEIAENGGRITVDFEDGSHASARIVGSDPLTDTALVQAEGVSGLTPATIGESSNVDVGQAVVAIGSPFGLDATVTSGIVSALDRPVNVGSDGRGNATVYPAIQTDAAINPGNSGGPLVDLNGRVIGINASIQSTTNGSGEAGSIGLGFAIPIDEVLPIIEQMKNGETPTHARLGVSVEDVATGGQGAVVSDGARIREIAGGSAAGEAGLRSGDVITGIDDTLITDSDSLVARIRAYRPGDEVEVTYLRDGEEHSTRLTLGSDAGNANS